MVQHLVKLALKDSNVLPPQQCHSAQFITTRKKVSKLVRFVHQVNNVSTPTKLMQSHAQLVTMATLLIIFVSSVLQVTSALEVRKILNSA